MTNASEACTTCHPDTPWLALNELVDLLNTRQCQVEGMGWILMWCCQCGSANELSFSAAKCYIDESIMLTEHLSLHCTIYAYLLAVRDSKKISFFCGLVANSHEMLAGDPGTTWSFTLELVTELKWQKYSLHARLSMAINYGSISLLLTCTKPMISCDTSYWVHYNSIKLWCRYKIISDTVLNE